MTKAQVKSVALFFYFSLPKEHHVFRASRKTVAQCRKQLKKEQKLGQADPHALIVLNTYRFWKKYRRSKHVRHRRAQLEAGWQLPENLDLGPWRQFQKEADPDELLTVVWSQILGFSEDEIASGLGITKGTVRYRIGNGLRRLGSMLWIGGGMRA